jgi:hypothetical protein
MVVLDVTGYFARTHAKETDRPVLLGDVHPIDLKGIWSPIDKRAFLDR